MHKLGAFLNKIEERIIIVLMAVLTITAFTQVFFRFVIKSPLPWSEELMRFIFIWCIYIAAAAGVKRGVHVSVTFFISHMPKKIQRVLQMVIYSFCILLCVLVIFYGIQIIKMQITYGQVSAAMGIPIALVYTALPVGSCLIMYHFLEELVCLCKRKE